jgi:phosphate transport system protein
MIVGIMRISNDLERIADQCVNIAERTIFLCQHPPLDPVRAMEQLIEMSKKMFSMAIASIRDMDAQEAKKIPPLDDYADEYNMQVLKSLIEVMAASSPGFEKRVLKMRRSIQTIIISRCLERIADLSTNIGEHVAFIAEGINIKHQQI